MTLLYQTLYDITQILYDIIILDITLYQIRYYMILLYKTLYDITLDII